MEPHKKHKISQRKNTILTRIMEKRDGTKRDKGGQCQQTVSELSTLMLKVKNTV